MGYLVKSVLKNIVEHTMDHRIKQKMLRREKNEKIKLQRLEERKDTTYIKIKELKKLRASDTVKLFYNLQKDNVKFELS